MTELVKQPSRFPTRKILAVILSGVILGVCQSLLRLFWPEHPFAPYMEDVDIWLQGLIMVIAGYITREREKDVETSKPVQVDSLESGGSADSQLSFDKLWCDEKASGRDKGGSEDSPTGSQEAGEVS